MVDSYINKKTKKLKLKEEINSYIFGLFFGISISLMSIFKILYGYNDFVDIPKYHYSFLIFGIICILIATICPNFILIKFLRNIIVKLFNFIGNILLRFILLILYFIFVVPVGLFIKKDQIVDSSFTDYKNSYQMKLSKHRYLKVLKLFSSEYFYIIPLIIILIILSIFVVLITTSIFTPFIYSLF